MESVLPIAVPDTWLLKGGYAFDNNFAFKGFYAENTAADYYNKAGSTEIDYKGAQAENAGSYGLWLAYRHFGKNAFIASPWMLSMLIIMVKKAGKSVAIMLCSKTRFLRSAMVRARIWQPTRMFPISLAA